MPHPILNDRKNTIIYFVVWVLIAAVHTLILWFLVDITPYLAVADSLVFNLLFMGMGLSVWYTIRYSGYIRGLITDQVLNHILSGVVAIGIWLGVGYLILYFILSEQTAYLEFLNRSIPARVISGLFYYAVLVLIYYLNLNTQDRQERIRNEARLRLQVREAEIDRLKAQINPHFLFNSLNSVSSLIGDNPGEAREMVIKLSDFLRYSLEYKENEMTTLKSELDHIKSYIGIEKVRFGNRMSFYIDLQPECLDMRLPHMILQPLVENAIKHGVYESTEPVEIRLHAACDERELLNVTISNDYDARVPARKGKGIGLTNTMHRMKLVYNSDRFFSVDRTANHFTVQLTFPQLLTHDNNL